MGRNGAVVLSASFHILKGSGKLPQTSTNQEKFDLEISLFFLFPNPFLTHKLPSLFLGMEEKIPSCFDKNPTFSTWNRLPSLPNPAFLGHLCPQGDILAPGPHSRGFSLFLRLLGLWGGWGVPHPGWAQSFGCLSQKREF